VTLPLRPRGMRSSEPRFVHTLPFAHLHFHAAHRSTMSCTCKPATSCATWRQAAAVAGPAVCAAACGLSGPGAAFQQFLLFIVPPLLQLFFRDETGKGRSQGELYDLVQHAGNIVPRLYLLCTGAEGGRRSPAPVVGLPHGAGAVAAACARNRQLVGRRVPSCDGSPRLDYAPPRVLTCPLPSPCSWCLLHPRRRGPRQAHPARRGGDVQGGAAPHARPLPASLPGTGTAPPRPARARSLWSQPCAAIVARV
jgi:hypothetical protein